MLLSIHLSSLLDVLKVVEQKRIQVPASFSAEFVSIVVQAATGCSPGFLLLPSTSDMLACHDALLCRGREPSFGYSEMAEIPETLVML